MAFGHGLSVKTHDFRSIPVAVGDCLGAKRAGLTQLRNACLVALRHFAEIAFEQEPLNGTLSKKELTAKLLKAQKGYAGLNKAYLERCRTSVIAAVSEQHKRYLGQLIGRLRNCAAEIPAADRKVNEDGIERRYYYVRLDVQNEVALEELEALQFCAEEGPAAMTLLRHTLSGQPTGLTELQSAVVLEIHRQVQDSHRAPDFGGADTVVALPLDYRVLPKEWRDLPGTLETSVAQLLQDPSNRLYAFFLDIAHPTPSQPRLRLPLVLSADLLERQFCKGERKYAARGLTLLLGPTSVEVRLSVAQPKEQPVALDKVQYLLARDFGQRNTITLSLLKLEAALDAEQVKELQAMGKSQAHAWLTENALPGEPAIAARWRYSGKNFLKRINLHAEAIDSLRSRIDVAYAALEAEKLALSALLALEPDADGLLPRIETRMAPKRHPLHKRVQVFFEMLSHILSLKEARRLRYRRIAAVKRHWFGFLANLEKEVALQWNAAVVAEDLTYTAIDKMSPAYKGRTFNRVMNHASRGQYARSAENKHAWNGVPVVKLPSWYTSTACFRHASINSKYRHQDVFKCSYCTKEDRQSEHADEHAADTLAVYMLLKPKHILVTNTSSGN